MLFDQVLEAAQQQAHAAWWQAGAAVIYTIGSFIAIGVAIWVPNKIEKRNQAARIAATRAIARDHALEIYRPIKKWQERLKVSIDFLREGSQSGEIKALTWLADQNLELPKTISDRRGKFHELGEAAEAVQALVYTCDGARDLQQDLHGWARGDYAVKNTADAKRVEHAKVFREFFDALNEALRQVEKLLA